MHDVSISTEEVRTKETLQKLSLQSRKEQGHFELGQDTKFEKEQWTTEMNEIIRPKDQHPEKTSESSKKVYCAG